MTSPQKPPQLVVQKDGFRIRQAQERGLALEALLRAHGVQLLPDTPLENIALNVFEVLYRRDGVTPDDKHDIRTALKHVIGLNDLAGLVLSVRDHKEFPSLVPHLRYLNEGASIQNMPSPVRDQATNHVFELFAGVLALHCGTQLALDGASAQGANPDVLITIDGRRWGIACKALHSNHPEAFITHLEKGIDQLEKSPAEVGFVLFTIKNILDQSRYWRITNPVEAAAGAEPYLSAFLDPNVPFQMLVDDANEIGNALNAYLPPGYLDQAFKGKKALPGFLIWAHVATAVVFDGLPVPTSARTMAWQHLGPVAPADFAILERFNDAAYKGDGVKLAAT